MMLSPGEMAVEAVPIPADGGLAAVGESAQRKAAVRLIPIIGVGYGLAYMDRVNISYASLQMNQDLHFSASVYAFGAGLFFIGYALCEVCLLYTSGTAFPQSFPAIEKARSAFGAILCQRRCG